MSDALRVHDAPRCNDVPEDPLAFLEGLEGASAWHVAGRDRSRTRVVTTLLHGNEPSGFLAMHAWLRSGVVPAVDAICVVANVEAARLHPVFTHRSVPGRRDLNRCFGDPRDTEGVDPEARIAHAILDLIDHQRPEAVVDLHNNTGRNPAYAIGLDPSREALALAARFGRHFVWSHLRLGALLEAVSSCPAVTVEVGKSGDDAADRIARAGLSALLETESLFEPLDRGVEVRILRMPMRARMRPGRRLVMAQALDPSAHLTMPDDLDRHNFEVVPAGARVGWVGPAEADCPLELIDEAGRDRAADYFERQHDALVARRPFMPIMITMDAAIATSDCLFYVVHDVRQSSSE
ncbi:MAG: succinylglutamate desuccinylase/aspartoacylase family protein [Spirochaetaceae bacterium]|nr:succinylglutamate desuccinylase/aspartoacylase family protein [Myxococcales bacterium]MCB9725729.1 succinylglutamate desuccinylase/aspartoacylase family protein [Spirochaetaceae bacterium]HPG25629.1 succinylglutamate desuccinylase/aspartoacylase family protein [Myxococcota bacterium]